MSEGERYLVELDLRRVGDFSIGAVTAKISAAETATHRFRKGWDGLKDSVAPIGNAIDGVAAKMFSLAKTGATIGGGALLGGAVYGVTRLNNELEQATISLGAIFNANGIASSVPQGMQRAQDVIGQMRIDAKKLPGEFGELLDIFKTAAVPGFQTGASVQKMEALSAQAMAAGKTFTMQNDMVAREFAMLLGGHAGSHNRFGSYMGLTGDAAKKFNSLSADKRLDVLTKELGKYSGAIDEFGKSFDAQTSTLVDNLKGFGIKATGPLFGSVKSTLADVNGWFIAHEDQVDRFAGRVGQRLDDAFHTGVQLIEEWWPSIERFGEKAYDRLAAIWVDVKPYVEQFGAAVKKALDDPNHTIDKLLELAKYYAEFKLGQGAAGAAGGVLSAGRDVATMVLAAKQLGVLGGVGGLAKGGELLGRAGSALGTGGAAALPYAAAALPPALLAGGLWYGAFGGVKTREDHDQDAKYSGIDKADAMFKKLDEEGVHYNDMMQMMRDEANFMRAKFQDVTSAAFELEFGLRAAANAERMSASDLDADNIREKNKAFLAGPLKPAVEGAKKKIDPKHKGGGGGIQKVEIVVTNNNNPSRVARVITGHLVRLSRNSGQSPDVRNYSALEDG